LFGSLIKNDYFCGMKEKDLTIICTKGHGPGGQHKNKVETCVVITHIPTGIQEMCQDTRSKARNLKLAKDRLSKKIQKYQNDQINKAKNETRKELIKNQKVVRTYNYNRNEVYDNRSKSKHDLKKFLAGEVDFPI